MKKYSYLVIILILVFIFLFGCGNGEEKAKDKVDSEVIDISKIIMRNNLFYKKNDNKPFSGKVVGYYKNGHKKFEIDHQDGKRHGKYLSWFEDGKKDLELIYINGNVKLK